MFGVWFVFDLLARVVLTCMPGGDLCVLKLAGWPLHFLVVPASVPPAAPRYLFNHWPVDFLVSLLTLCLAIWAITTVLYPAEDLSQPPCPSKGASPTNA
jgi:hypothetical protein